MCEYTATIAEAVVEPCARWAQRKQAPTLYPRLGLMSFLTQSEGLRFGTVPSYFLAELTAPSDLIPSSPFPVLLLLCLWLLSQILARP